MAVTRRPCPLRNERSITVR